MSMKSLWECIVGWAFLVAITIPMTIGAYFAGLDLRFMYFIWGVLGTLSPFIFLRDLNEKKK